MPFVKADYPAPGKPIFFADNVADANAGTYQGDGAGKTAHAGDVIVTRDPFEIYEVS